MRSSNFAYSQTKIADYLCFYFSAIGIGSSIIASEINMCNNEDDRYEEWVKYMMAIANVSSLFLSKYSDSHQAYSGIYFCEWLLVH